MNKFVLFFAFVLSFQLPVWSHDPNTVSIIIQNDDEAWFGKVTFSTVGLQNMIRKELSDSLLHIDTSEFCKQKIKQTLKNYLKITINKEQELALESLDLILTNHVVEMSFLISKIPPRPEFWELNFEGIKSSKNIQHIVYFYSKEIGSKFLVEKKRVCAFRKLEKGRFLRVK